MAGGSMKDIKRRIKSVESTGQITKAMELVASSKLRRAKERAESSAPFFSILYQTICEISSMNTELSSIYIKPKEAKCSLAIVIAGDRGLAGGYNVNVLKLANNAINEKKQKGIDTKVIAIGKKSCDYYEKHGNLVKGFSGVADDLDLIKVTRISNIIIDLYKKGEIDEVVLYYTQFISTLSQEPLELNILPLTNTIDDTQSNSKSIRPLCIYEPSPESVFNAIIPDYVSGIVYGAVVESYASEQGARRTAMESANDNAKEMVETLSLSYNRARQAAITQEISEIVSGVNAS